MTSKVYILSCYVGIHWRYRQCGLRERSVYSDSLRARLFGEHIPVWVKISAPIQPGPETHPTSCTMGTGSLLGGKAAGP